MNFKALGSRDVGQGRLHRFHAGDPKHPPDVGLGLIEQAAHDTPIFLVRVENGLITRVLHEVTGPFRLCNLVVNQSGSAATAYACAYRLGQQAHTLLVARGDLPVPELPKLDLLPD